ncbi:hypothetical protein EGW08_003006, partial [Elysia chlorotica]
GSERRASQILNTRAIRLTIPDVTLKDEGSYSCHVTTMEGKVKIIGNQTVNVDVPPRPVTGVQCRVYNWEEMTCTWEQSVQFRHPEHVNVSVFWVTTDVQQDCPSLTLTSCHWGRDHYRHGLSYSIRIAVTYSVGGAELDHASRLVRVNTAELVEPAPVRQFEASGQSSRCIRLTWQVPRVMHRAKSFQLQIRRPGGNWADIASPLTSKVDETHSSHETLVCDLERNSRYDFRVAVMPRFYGKPQGFRSEWQTATAFTDEDVPSAAPSICPGCFYEILDSHLEYPDTRRVRIMWKDIPEASRHGTLTHYTVSYWSLTSQFNHSVISRVESDTLTCADLDLPSRQEDYLVKIAGATKKGESPIASYILVPGVRNMPAPPHRFLVKRNPSSTSADRLFLSWAALEGRSHLSKRSSAHLDQRHAPSPLAVSDLYIVWCLGSRISWRCQGNLAWVKLPPHQVTYELVTDWSNKTRMTYLLACQPRSKKDKTSSAAGSTGANVSTREIRNRKQPHKTCARRLLPPIRRAWWSRGESPDVKRKAPTSQSIWFDTVPAPILLSV